MILNTHESSTNMGGCKISVEEDGAYITYELNGEIVKKKLGESGLGEPVTLWTNSKVDSSFAAQKITLDLSEYNYVTVECRYSTTYSNSETVCPLIEVGGAKQILVACTFSNAGTTIRQVSANDSGVTFSTGYHYSGSHNESATYCIPTKIIGYK